ncbi:MAG: lipocalin-like domain-containing protein [Betaproteobacteria bacterium]
MNRTTMPFRSLLAAVFAGVSLFALPACAQSLKDQLVGTWKLVSSTRYVGDTPQPWLFGTNSMRILMYTADGYMCANLMNLDRANFPSGDIRSGTAAEKATAFDTFFAYCSRFEVNDAERFVVHKVESSLFPNWTGGSQKRFVELNGNRLALRTPPLLAEGKEVVAVLVWERAQ